MEDSPTPNPSRKREGDSVAPGADRTLLPFAGGAGSGSVKATAKFRDRDTPRARELRNAATPMERKLWRYLSNSQLGVKFVRQLKVEGFFADFICRQRKLIVEVDGYSHDVAPERDVRRDAVLKRVGYRVLHFSNNDVRDNVEGVVEAIRLALRD